MLLTVACIAFNSCCLSDCLIAFKELRNKSILLHRVCIYRRATRNSRGQVSNQRQRVHQNFLREDAACECRFRIDISGEDTVGGYWYHCVEDQ